nr:SET domain-containing protein [Candidatus Sigynarchaeota archaeon]
MFAVENIPSGTKIWEYKEGFDLVFMPDDLLKLPSWQAQYLEKYCFMFEQNLFFCVDDARYMNHSETPNAIDRIDGTYAIRDIKAGEEITCDYHKMGFTEEDLAFNTGWMYHEPKHDDKASNIV